MSSQKAQLKLPNLRGKLAVVTGASDGVGREIALQLALAGADVVMPVRNAAKGAAVRDRISAMAPAVEVSTRVMDLANLSTVRELGTTLRNEGRPINFLVNNAGVMNPPVRQETADGFELQFGANHLGHFALVGELLPLLREGGAHVTTQSSIAARRASINWDDLQWQNSYKAERAYGQSKLACIHFGTELQRRSDSEGWGLMSNVSHPGVTLTNLVAAQARPGNVGDELMVRGLRLATRVGILQTADHGALPALYAVADPAARGGGFYGPNGFQQVSGPPQEHSLFPPARSKQDASRLWVVSQELTGAPYPQA